METFSNVNWGLSSLANLAEYAEQLDGLPAPSFEVQGTAIKLRSVRLQLARLLAQEVSLDDDDSENNQDGPSEPTNPPSPPPVLPSTPPSAPVSGPSSIPPSAPSANVGSLAPTTLPQTRKSTIPQPTTASAPNDPLVCWWYLLSSLCVLITPFLVYSLCPGLYRVPSEGH